MSLRRAVVLVAALAHAARAGSPIVDKPEAIDVDREASPPGRVEFGFDGGAPVGAYAAGAQIGYVDTPLTLREGDLLDVPVRHRETLALGGALSIGERLVVDARVAGGHQVGDRLATLGSDTRGLQRFVTLDTRLGARLRIAGDERRAVFLRGELVLPTGNDNQFAGDARWGGAWFVIGRLAPMRDLVTAATVGIRLRAAEVQVGNRLVGDELDFGVGAAYGLPPIARLWCVPAQLRATAELIGALGDRVGGQKGPSPVEARLGLVGTPLAGVTIGGHLGLGLDDQIGSPRLRALVELAWSAPPRPRAVKPVVLTPPPADDDEDDEP